MTSNLLNKSANEIASQYRQVWALQAKAPVNERWTFGAELSLLKKAHRVAVESERAIRAN